MKEGIGLLLLRECIVCLGCVFVAEQIASDQLVPILRQDLSDLLKRHQILALCLLETLQLHENCLAKLLRPTASICILLRELAEHLLVCAEGVTLLPQQETVDTLTVQTRAEEETLAVSREIAHEGAERLFGFTRIVNRKLA